MYTDTDRRTDEDTTTIWEWACY